MHKYAVVVKSIYWDAPEVFKWCLTKKGALNSAERVQKILLRKGIRNSYAEVWTKDKVKEADLKYFRSVNPEIKIVE